jgi:hypothetical protein
MAAHQPVFDVGEDQVIASREVGHAAVNSNVEAVAS